MRTNENICVSYKTKTETWVDERTTYDVQKEKESFEKRRVKKVRWNVRDLKNEQVWEGSEYRRQG